MAKMVRIKPFDKARRQTTRRFVIGGFRFEIEKGWYRVEDENLADHLKTVKASQDPMAPCIFDVVDEKEAEDLERKEYEAANPERKITEAVKGAQTVKTKDLDLGPAPDVNLEPEDDESSEGEDEGDENSAEPEGTGKSPF